MASAPEPAAAPPPPADPAPAADRGGLFFNLGRGAKGVALLLFLIPWVTVSCGGTEIASMSGLDLATGSFDVRNPMTGEDTSLSTNNCINYIARVNRDRSCHHSTSTTSNRGTSV